MSGAIATEYAAHVAAVAIPSTSPLMLPETPPSFPSAINATPANETAAAIQKRVCSRSSPIANAINAVKMGVAPRISAIVDAFENVSAYTYESWFSQMPSPAARTINARSRRPTRNDRSVPYVNHVKRIVAAPYRVVE